MRAKAKKTNLDIQYFYKQQHEFFYVSGPLKRIELIKEMIEELLGYEDEIKFFLNRAHGPFAALN